jgi:hypothetical protein
MYLLYPYSSLVFDNSYERVKGIRYNDVGGKTLGIEMTAITFTKGTCFLRGI